MRRFLMALAVLLTAGVTPTFAGYIILRVLLEGGGATPGGETVPGGPGGIAPLGGPGAPLGGPPRGSGLGPPGGMGGSKAGPGPMMPGGPMAPGGPAAQPAGEFDHTRSIVVVVPLETDFLKGRLDTTKNPSVNNPEFRKFVVQHYGQKLSASLFVDSTTIQLYEELLGTPAPKKTRRTEVLAKHQQWLGGKSDVQVLYDAVVLALQAGMVKEAVAYADELVAVANDKKLAIPDRDVKPFVAAWASIQKAVSEAPAAPSDAETWKERLDYRNGGVSVIGHYAIVAPDNGSEETNRRAAQLNDNFKAFFLWHATRGVALPVPNKPLIAVIAPQTAAMRALNVALDGLPMADAFYAPDHGLLVLSPERMDDVGQTFLRQNQQLFSKGLNRAQLLAGQIPKLDATGQNGTKPEDVAHAATLAAIEKLAIDDAEIAAVSREGTRQLLYATGTLPKHVTLPTWLTNGAVNFFTRPRGPAYVTVGDEDKPYMHVALATGYGNPNYVLQRYFRDLGTKKELPKDADRLLENVLSDVYFTGIKNGDDPDPAPPKKVVKKTAPNPMQPGGIGPMSPGPPGGAGGAGGLGEEGRPPGGPMIPGGPIVPGAGGTRGDVEDPAVALRRKQQRLALKANATSWALYYYLAKSRPAELKQYIAELNKLPRDLPIDGRTALAVFVRVFKLASNADGSADPAAVKKFADEWLTYINTVPLVGVDVPLVVPEPPKAGTNPGGFPPGMGPPGGRPGGGDGDR